MGCGWAWAENLPGVYEFATFCHQIRRPCGVVLRQKSTGGAEEYSATIWKGDPSISKTVPISKTKFRHIDHTFHLMYLWKSFQEGPFPLEKLPKNDQMVLLNTTTSKGQHHLLVPRYSSDLTSAQQTVLGWELFLKAQVMKVNSMAFKKDFSKP